MGNARTIQALLASGGDHDVAIAAHGAPPLTYAAVRSLVDETIATLNRLGVGRNDRVAIVLPNGPEMATAFVSVAAGATSAPLNPAYRGDEFAPGRQVLTDAEIDAWIRKTVITAHHPAGTCAMGIGPDSVLDPTLRVRGVEGLEADGIEEEAHIAY